MVNRNTAPPGTGRRLLEAAERRVSAAGRTHVRLDCLAYNAQLTAYYRDAYYRIVGHKEGKPQPGGTPKSFTLLEKELGRAGSQVSGAANGRVMTGRDPAPRSRA